MSVETARLLDAYDVEEVSVLVRMKRIMVEQHGYEPDYFDGMGFLEIESIFLDDCGEEDFRPADAG